MKILKLTSVFKSKLIDRKYLFYIFLCALNIFSLAFFTSSTEVYLLMAVICFSFIYIIYNKYKKSDLKSIFHFSIYSTWLFIANLLFVVSGLITNYPGEYSFKFHLVCLAGYFIIYNLLKERNSFYKSNYLGDIALILIMIIFPYTFFIEYSRFQNNLAKLLLGSSWFRLGDNLPGINSNGLAMMISISLILLIRNYKYLENKHKVILYKIGILISLFMLLLCGSKKGLILMFFALFIVPLMEISKKDLLSYIKKAFIAVFILFTIVFYNPFFYGIIGYRVISFIDEIGIYSFEKDKNHSTTSGFSSTDLRKGMYIKGIELFCDSPLTGYGWNYFKARAGFKLYSHNNYIEILVSMGLFGFVAYYSIYLVALMKICFEKYESSSKKFNLSLLAILLVIDASCISFYAGIFDYLILSIIFTEKTKSDLEKIKNSFKCEVLCYSN